MKRRHLFTSAFLILLGIVLTLPFTPAGSRLLVNALDNMTALDIHYGEGSFSDTLVLDHLNLELDVVSISVQGVELELSLGCLLYSKVCAEKIAITGLEVGVLDVDDNSDAATGPDGQIFKFPFALEANSLSIGETRVRWTGGEWNNGSIQGSLAISGSEVAVADVLSENSSLRIETGADRDTDSGQPVILPRIHLPFELLVDGLELEKPRWTYDELQHQHESLQLSGRWRGTELDLQQLKLSSENWGRVSLKGELEFSGDWPVNLQAYTQIAQPPIWAGLHDRSIELTATGFVAELQLSMESSGVQNIQLTGVFNPLERHLPFKVQLGASWAGALPLQNIAGLDGQMPAIELISPWTAIATGSLEQQSFSLVGQLAGYGYSNLEVELLGQHRDSRLILDAATLRDTNSSSLLEMNGLLTLGTDLQWDLKIDSSGMKLPEYQGMYSGRIQGYAISSGRAAADSWSVAIGDVKLRGEVNSTPADLSGSIMLDSELQLGESNIQLMANATRLSIVSNGVEAPEIKLELADLGMWLPDSRGSLSLNVTLEESRERLLVIGSARDLAWQGAVVPLGQIEGYYIYGEQKYRLSTTLESLRFQDSQLTGVQLDLEGDEASQTLKLATGGDIQTKLLISGAVTDNRWSGQLQPATIATAAGSWTLDAPVPLRWNDEALGVEGHCWRGSGSRICAGELLLGEAGRGSLDIQGSLESFEGISGSYLSIAGNFEASMNGTWETGSGVLGEASAKLSQGQLSRLTEEGEELVVGWDVASLEAKLDNQGASIEGEAWSEGVKQVGLELALPGEKTGEVRGAIVFDSFRLARLLKPLIPTISDHDGVLNGRLELAGTVEQPLVHGKLSLEEGRFRMVGNPTTLEQLSAVLTAAGDRLNIVGSGTLGGGETRVDGNFLLRPEPKLTLNIVGERQRVLLPPGVEATISEDITLEFQGGHMGVAGDITVHEGILEHEQLPAGSVGMSEDVVEVDVEGAVLSTRDSLDLAADIRVNIQDSFRVVGTGVTTTVGGQLELQKKPSLPMQLFGELNIIDGEIDAFGQRLEVRKGNIAFTGEADNPNLNFRAEREIKGESVTVGVEVLGELEEFSFNLYSSPTLSEAQMMSYLIRGRGLDKGAEADGAAVALSMGLGAINQTGIVSGINKIPGLSNVSLGTEGTANETTATLGGYVGKRIYLAYGVGVYEPINVLTTRFYLQSRLWLEVVSSLESSADIYYSFDIK